MAFVELIPKRSFIEGDKIYCYFSKKGAPEKFNYSFCRIKISKDIAHKINLNEGDRVCFSYNKNNSRIWNIKKTDKKRTRSGFSSGFKLCNFNKSFYLIQLTWKIFEPTKSDFFIRCLPYKILENGDEIEIDATLTNREERV